MEHVALVGDRRDASWILRLWCGKLMEKDHLENPHRPTWEDNIKGVQ